MREAKRALGPLDRRKKVTRCQACSARRIKCEGGTPCNYCSRTQRTCLPQSLVPDGYIFVAATQTIRAQTASISSPRPHNDSVYLDLFAAFLRRCQFTGGFIHVDRDLFDLVHSSPLLQDLALAIGALEASRRASSSPLHAPGRARATAFTCYGKALKALREQLAMAGAAHSEDVLWSTFLFGLFELMSETSGERWAKHVVHGTSKMLALAGPTSLSTSLHQRLFDAFQVLEANRAIFFGDETFLEQPAWASHHPSRCSLSSGEGILWDPVDTIFSLKLRVAAFSKRLFDQVGSIPPQLRCLHPTVQALAHEGVEISQALCQWHQQYLESLVSETEYTRLACIEFHALALFLCQTYGYYAGWIDLQIPSLAPQDVEVHVKAILSLSRTIQAAPHVPGVLLLFALRMAGAHATDAALMQLTMQRLDDVYWEGFVVSEWVKRDLQELWRYRQAQGLSQAPYC